MEGTIAHRGRENRTAISAPSFLIEITKRFFPLRGGKRGRRLRRSLERADRVLERRPFDGTHGVCEVAEKDASYLMYRPGSSAANSTSSAQTFPSSHVVVQSWTITSNPRESNGAWSR